METKRLKKQTNKSKIRKKRENLGPSNKVRLMRRMNNKQNNKIKIRKKRKNLGTRNKLENKRRGDY